MKMRIAGLLVFSALLAPFAMAATDSGAFVKDSPITTKVKEKLTADKMNGIDVETDRRGEVWLSGTVDSQAVADDAVDMAKSVSGVKAVHSYIEVKKQG
jgi:hyperosmotically inducible periplasmic protein